MLTQDPVQMLDPIKRTQDSITGFIQTFSGISPYSKLHAFSLTFIQKTYTYSLTTPPKKHSPHYFGIGNMTNYIKLKQERVNKFLCCAQNNKKRFLHENKKSFATYLAI